MRDPESRSRHFTLFAVIYEFPMFTHLSTFRESLCVPCVPCQSTQTIISSTRQAGATEIVTTKGTDLETRTREREVGRLRVREAVRKILH